MTAGVCLRRRRRRRPAGRRHIGRACRACAAGGPFRLVRGARLPAVRVASLYPSPSCVGSGRQCRPACWPDRSVERVCFICTAATAAAAATTTTTIPLLCPTDTSSSTPLRLALPGPAATSCSYACVLVLCVRRRIRIAPCSAT
jgi:hypothetical protein